MAFDPWRGSFTAICGDVHDRDSRASGAVKLGAWRTSDFLRGITASPQQVRFTGECFADQVFYGYLCRCRYSSPSSGVWMGWK